MKYEYTINIGNEIQSIASRQFLPKIDYYIDHEKLNEFDDDKNVKLIMNGFYLDDLNAWPPSKNIDPLLISMYFRTEDEFKKVIFSQESKNYLNEFGPVGCRDIHTEKLLNENGIDAYFSGCLTLTLNPGKKKNINEINNEYIVINCDNPNKIKSFLKNKTEKKIYIINQDFPPGFSKAFLHEIPKSLYNLTSYYSADEKFFMAENLLKLYENASCVITDRLHCALPCLALKTPVLLFNSRPVQQRFDGLNDLCLVSNFKDYERNYNIFNVDNPPENSDKYLKLRKNLIKKCKNFTGHINESCYSVNEYSRIIENNMQLFSRQSEDTRNYIIDVLKTADEYEKKIKKQEKIIKQQKDKINMMKNSKSWKITEPLRKIRK